VPVSGTESHRNAERAEIAEKTFLSVLCGLCILFFVAAGCGGGTDLFKQYEYEEEMYLALDGSATLYVNSSIAALNALRGSWFDTSASTRVNRDAVRAFYTGPNTRVPRVTESRRSGRRFLHVRIEVDDVRKLSAAAPFAWSTYSLERHEEQFIYKQMVGASAGKDVGSVGWNGQEVTAFRMHRPSKIDWHNTPTAISSPGNNRSRIVSKACRSRSKRAWRRSRFSIERCGCSGPRSLRSPSCLSQ
jgi:hypothetical protein